MIATDLDGTLLGPNRRVSDRDRTTLHELGVHGVVRVVATGRSLYSARKVLPRDLPLDYLVFSSGAGAVTWPDEVSVFGRDMAPELACDTHAVLRRHRVDFMAQSGVPHTHRFSWVRGSSGPNADFDHRLKLYAEHARPFDGSLADAVSQFVIVHPESGGVECWATLREALPDCHVVRTTSPLDGSSVWIEIFPEGVSKASGCALIAARHGIRAETAMAVGNDFNDIDMLDWVGSPFIVANGPQALRERYEVVSSNSDSGLSDSVERWRRLSGA